MYCLCLFLLYPFYATCDEKTSLSCLSISCFIHFRNMREGKEAQVVERNGLSFSITTRNFARLEMLTFPQTRASKLTWKVILGGKGRRTFQGIYGKASQPVENHDKHP